MACDAKDEKAPVETLRLPHGKETFFPLLFGPKDQTQQDLPAR